MPETASSDFQPFVDEADQALPLFQVLIKEYRAQQAARSAQLGQESLPEYPAAGLKERLEIYRSLQDEKERKRFNPEAVASLYRWLHTKGVRRSALCFSGGGIRSATCGLGVL